MLTAICRRQLRRTRTNPEYSRTRSVSAKRQNKSLERLDAASGCSATLNIVTV
jgi:hypothetical protein